MLVALTPLLLLPRLRTRLIPIRPRDQRNESSRKTGMVVFFRGGGVLAFSDG